MNRKTADRIDKRDLCALIEVAHREGIGHTRLARLLGYSDEHMRRLYRLLGLPPLRQATQRAPSAYLCALLQLPHIKRVADGN